MQWTQLTMRGLNFGNYKTILRNTKSIVRLRKQYL